MSVSVIDAVVVKLYYSLGVPSLPTVKRKLFEKRSATASTVACKAAKAILLQSSIIILLRYLAVGCATATKARRALRTYIIRGSIQTPAASDMRHKIDEID